MDLKQRLAEMADHKGNFLALGFRYAELCKEALAEIERLEAAATWQGDESMFNTVKRNTDDGMG